MYMGSFYDLEAHGSQWIDDCSPFDETQQEEKWLEIPDSDEEEGD